MEKEHEEPETLRRHHEMFRLREQELKHLGTLNYREILDNVNDPATYREP